MEIFLVKMCILLISIVVASMIISYLNKKEIKNKRNDKK